MSQIRIFLQIGFRCVNQISCNGVELEKPKHREVRGKKDKDVFKSFLNCLLPILEHTVQII